jgi:hypothetical protein
VAQLTSNQYLLVQTCSKETAMIYTTPVQKYTRFSVRIQPARPLIVMTQGTRHVGLGRAHTSISNGCAVQSVRKSSRSEPAP